MLQRLFTIAMITFCSDANAALLTDFTCSFAADDRVTRQLADFDNNGRISGEDYLTWQRSFGRVSAESLPGDANADGIVTMTDFKLWKSQFGGLAATKIPDSVAFK